MVGLSRALIDNFYNKNILIDLVIRQKYKIVLKYKSFVKNIFVVKNLLFNTK